MDEVITCCDECFAKFQTGEMKTLQPLQYDSFTGIASCPHCEKPWRAIRDNNFVSLDRA